MVTTRSQKASRAAASNSPTAHRSSPPPARKTRSRSNTNKTASAVHSQRGRIPSGHVRRVPTARKPDPSRVWLNMWRKGIPRKGPVTAPNGVKLLENHVYKWDTQVWQKMGEQTPLAIILSFRHHKRNRRNIMCELVLVAEADQLDHQVNIIPSPTLGNRPREQGIRGQVQVVRTDLCEHVQAHAVRCAMPVLPLDPLGVRFEGATNDCSWIPTKIWLSYQKHPKGFPQYKVEEDSDYGICRRDGACVWAREYEPERQVVLYCSRCGTWFHRQCLLVVDNLANVRRRRLVRHSHHLEWQVPDEEKDDPASIVSEEHIEQDLSETESTGVSDDDEADTDDDRSDRAGHSGREVSASPANVPSARGARRSSRVAPRTQPSEDEDADEEVHGSSSDEDSEVDELDSDPSNSGGVEDDDIAMISDEDEHDDDEDDRNLWRAILGLPVQRGYPQLVKPAPLSFEILLLAARALPGRPADVAAWVSATYKRSYVYLPPDIREDHANLFWTVVAQSANDRVVYRCPRGHFV
ncbi:hypothetical protein C8Q76DRAFT_796882 [Earliella scabrosa]|nr:hypothetical protein C8Q76DRAFT_796882 [Earliella scabrosa]